MRLITKHEPAAPEVIECSTSQPELDKVRIRDKAHTKEGNGIAAGHQGIPMDSPRHDSRPGAHWPRLSAGFSDGQGNDER